MTPYYLSLLNTNTSGYDDATIRSYILYSEELVDTYGRIKAWEKEDIVVSGQPNAAGWLLPEGHNITPSLSGSSDLNPRFDGACLWRAVRFLPADV